MEAFEYIAYDVNGRKKKGFLNAESSVHARKVLKSQGLIPIEVSNGGAESMANSSVWSKLFNGSQKIKLIDLSLCLRQLCTLMKSGLPLEDSLKLMTEQSENDQLKKLVTSWRNDLREGHSLSQSMQRSRYIVPNNLIATVSVGEETGHLNQVLERMADELEVSLENRQAVKGAMVYPAVVLSVAGIVLYILLTVAVPKILVIFESTDQALPTLTVIVIAVSEFTENYGLYCIVLLAMTILGIKLLLRNKQRRYQFHKKLIHMQRLGRWSLLADVADWCRSLGLLLTSGVPIIVALKVANASVQNLWLAAELEHVRDKVKQGSSLYYSLKNIDVFPAFLMHMVSSGEASSELDSMLLKVGEYYSNQLKTSIESSIKLIQPIIIVVLGMLVAVIISAIFMPIMNMSSMIG